jgi:hypothetical protein
LHCKLFILNWQTGVCLASYRPGLCYYCGRDSDSLRAGRSGVRTPWRGVGEIFRFQQVRPRGPPRLLYNGHRVSFPGVKRPGRDVNHPPPSSDVVEYGKSIPVPPLYACPACYGTAYIRGGQTVDSGNFLAFIKIYLLPQYDQ